MTVRELYQKVRDKAIRMGVSQELVSSEPFFIELINDALTDFTTDTHCNMKHKFTTTVDGQEYYTLPTDILVPLEVALDGKLIPGLSPLDYFRFKNLL